MGGVIHRVRDIHFFGGGHKNHNSVRLGSFICIVLVVSLDLMGDSVVSKWGRGGGIGYDPGEVYMGRGCMLCPCIMGGVTGTIAGTACSDD